ncbi:MAG: group 1 truncated hemoglobin [Deltaproteobacteria bacterium]|nr:group 1 truncated hemoglobin [Deltaproteobacteria bacterium]
MGSLIEQVGGVAALAPVMADFVARLARDPMIGFFFVGVDLQRLVQFELQFAARALGAEVAYEGRPLRQAHQKHRIADGQFNRRRELLRQTLRDHQVPQAACDALIEHSERLRGAVTYFPGQGCNHPTGGLVAVDVDADGRESLLDWP